MFISLRKWYFLEKFVSINVIIRPVSYISVWASLFICIGKYLLRFLLFNTNNKKFQHVRGQYRRNGIYHVIFCILYKVVQKLFDALMYVILNSSSQLPAVLLKILEPSNVEGIASILRLLNSRNCTERVLTWAYIVIYLFQWSVAVAYWCAINATLKCSILMTNVFQEVFI